MIDFDGFDLVRHCDIDYRALQYIAFTENDQHQNDNNSITNHNYHRHPAINLDYLLCPVCKTPFVKPYVTICGHTFCYECLIEAVKITNNTCPLDKTDLVRKQIKRETRNYNNNDDDDDDDDDHHNDRNDNGEQENDNTQNNEASLAISPAPLIIKALSDDLSVKCMNHNRGCQWIGQRTDIKFHLMTNCGYTRIRCGGGSNGSNGKTIKEACLCDKLIERRKLQTDICPHIQQEKEDINEENERQLVIDDDDGDGDVEGDFTAAMMATGSNNGSQKGVEVPRGTVNGNRPNSILLDTTTKILDCPNIEIGCNWKYEISEDYFHKFDKGNRIISNHLKYCQYQKLSEKLAMQDAKLQDFELKNSQLQNKYNWLVGSIPFLNGNSEYVNNLDGLQSFGDTEQNLTQNGNNNIKNSQQADDNNQKVSNDESMYVKQLIADNVQLNKDVTHLMATMNSLQLQFNQLSFTCKQQQLFNNEFQRIQTFQRMNTDRSSTSTNESESDLSDGFSSGRVKL